MKDEKQTDLIKSVEDIPEETVASTPIETALSPTDQLIRFALESDVDMEKLKQLIELKNSEEERGFKRAFDTGFGAMQAELKPITRSKQGDKGKYPPLEDLQKQSNATIFAHGFSYHWSEETLPDNGLRIVLHISGHGYTKTNYKDLPFYEPDKGAQSGKSIMNPLQAEGTRSSYGRRYTLVSGFGLVLQDEDTDGAFEFDDGVRYADYILAMDAETDAKALYDSMVSNVKDLRESGDNKGADFVKQYYSKRRQAIYAAT